MSEKYLVVENGVVVNVVVFGGGAWSPSAGQNLVLLTEELRSVDIGWTLVDGVWQAPPIIEVPPVEETEEITNV